MSEQGSRRPVLIAASAAAATIILCLAYRRYRQVSTSPPSSSLHRSNAVRRSRRRWRRGFAPREVEHNLLWQTACDNLERRTREGQPYGRYNNRLVFPIEDEHLEDGSLDLLPDRVQQICAFLSEMRPMSEFEQAKTNFHVTALLVQNFLREEFPPGYVIGEDVELLVQFMESAYGIDESCVRMIVNDYDHGKDRLSVDWDIRDDFVSSTSRRSPPSEGAAERASTQQAIEALRGPSHQDSSDDSDDDDDESDPGGSQNMLDLLYHIASEQAKREGYVHRDAGCSSCGTKPITGIRYHCANCFDFDLCEDCEAQQVHNKNHVFYKVRIPAPPTSGAHVKQVAPVWYPGNPNAFPATMPRELQQRLVKESGMDKAEMEASYEQFKCLAGEQIPISDDPTRLGMAISRQNFNKYFNLSNTVRVAQPNLIYDRIFAFYDRHDDGVITLDEYIIAVASLTDLSRGARLKRAFTGFDLDADGYVDRRDLLRILRAYYLLTKELDKERILLQNDFEEDIRDVVQGSQPISAAFSGHDFRGHVSRTGQDKAPDLNGDLVINTGPNTILLNDTDMRGDRSRAIGNAAVRDLTSTHPYRSLHQPPESDEQLLDPLYAATLRERSVRPLAQTLEADEDITTSDPNLHMYHWPPELMPEKQDVINALGNDVPLDEITDPVDRSRIIQAQMQRLDEESDKRLNIEREQAVEEFWRRRQFYLDEEEGMTKPPGYTEPDSSEDEAASIDEIPESAPQILSSSRRQSLRSRSSSKVRFDDSAFDTDHETRSNTSSRSIPMNERWGGLEFGVPEREVGQEILYQALQQGFNELVDPLFKKKEDDAMEAIATKTLRIKWAKQLDEHESARKKKAAEEAEALRQADFLRTQALFSNGVDHALDGQPSTATDQEETDHIQIMFGNSPIKSRTNQETVGPDISRSTQADNPDPTLPQNRPNDAAFVNLNVLRKTLAEKTDPSTNPPSESTLATWLRHKHIEEEAQRRGGYGRLSYREFCRLMIREANRDDDIFDLSLEPDKHGVLRPTREADDEDGNEGERRWSSSSKLKRMSFLCAWLELYQF